MERFCEGLRPADIEWVWVVEEERRATPDEIQRFCKAGIPDRSFPSRASRRV